MVIEGARGVGKTTMIMQRIKLSGEIGTSLYVDAGHTYFSSHSLYDFVEAFYKTEENVSISTRFTNMRLGHVR